MNVGHGHVFPRADGNKARCGGPAMCSECARDLARKNAQSLDSMKLSGEPTFVKLRLFNVRGDYVVTLTLPAFRPWPDLINWKGRRFAKAFNDPGPLPMYREATELKVDDDGEHLQTEV
jgi:hypothetical protein